MADIAETLHVDRPLAEQESIRLARVPSGPKMTQSRPANENDPGNAMILAKFRRRPAFFPYGIIATFITVLWSGGWLFDFAPSLKTVAPVDGRLHAIALLVVPLVVWSAAYMLWRAADMRHISEVMFQSAIRLVRPQDVASEGLTTIAQAVRSEVDLLVGGVESATKRAAVLEQSVKKEVADIERAFADNEERIRGLVSEIGNQSSALREATLLISNDTNPLINRLDNGTKHLDTIMATAQDTLARLEGGLRTMDDVSQRAQATISEIGIQSAHMEKVFSGMMGQIRDFAHQLSDQIDKVRQTSAALSVENVDFSRSVEYLEANIVSTLCNAVDRLTSTNQEITRTIERSGDNSADKIRERVTELAEIVQHTTSDLTLHLKTVSDDVATQLERASMDTAQLMEQSRDLVTQGMHSMTGELIERVSQSHSELIGFLGHSSAGISAAVEELTYSVSGHLNEASAQFIAGLDRTAGELIYELTSRSTGMSSSDPRRSSSLSRSTFTPKR